MPIIPLQEFTQHLTKGVDRIMAIDHGRKTLGLAISNPEWTIASPLATIARKNWQADMQALSRYVNEFSVRALIIGLALDEKGGKSKSAEASMSFAGRLKREGFFPHGEPLITFMDERFTTQEAERFLIDTLDISRQKRDKMIDHMAAQLILKYSLDAFEKNAHKTDP
jgi:putative Holliday junction resolvase